MQDLGELWGCRDEWDSVCSGRADGLSGRSDSWHAVKMPANKSCNNDEQEPSSPEDAVHAFLGGQAVSEEVAVKAGP